MSKNPEHSKARLLGIVYAVYFVTAVSGGLLVKGLAVRGDAIATAHNYAAHEIAVRSSSALGIVSVACYLALTTLLYALFRPVSQRLSLLATLFSAAACVVQVLSDVFLAPLQPLIGNQGAHEIPESAYLAQAFMAMHAQAIYTSLVLFGGFDILIGILVIRSRFLPRVFGVLMTLAGLGWLLYLWPPIADRLSQLVQPLGFLAEAVLMVWLLAKGVDEERWRMLASPLPVGPD